jgi:hypothetical protein
MTSTWKETLLQSLAIAYEVRQRQVDSSLELVEFPEPAPAQVALLQIYTDVLEEKDTPATAAKRINTWVLSVPDSDPVYDIPAAYYEVLRVLFSGAKELSSHQHLKTLADFTIELANLPNLHNNSNKPIKFHNSDAGVLVVIHPGEKIVLPCQTGGVPWSGLPDFALYIRDNLYGEPVRLRRGTEIGQDEEQFNSKAEDRYTNINTFAALIALQHPPQGSPLCSCADFAFATMAFLERKPNPNVEQIEHLVVRAVAAWLTIAGEEIVAAGSPSLKYDYTFGSLWKTEGGTNTIDAKRLRFWKYRVQQIWKSGRLSSKEAVEATIEAMAALDRLIAARG